MKLRREDSAPTSIRNALLVGVGRAITVTSLVILSAWAIGAPDLNPPPRTYHMEVVR